MAMNWGEPGELGARIRTERERLGMSLSNLAEASGLSKAYLVRLETDPDSNPSLQVLVRIAEALDLTAADLVGRPRVTLAEEPEIPTPLRVFADEAGLSQSEVRTLASIRWRRGEAPQTPQRWRYIYDSLRASQHLDERER